MIVNPSHLRFASFMQPFFNYGDTVNLSIPMTPGTIGASSSYSNSVSIGLANVSTVQMQVQPNWKDSNTYIVASYFSQALPDWTTLSYEMDFVGYFSGNNFIGKCTLYNYTAAGYTPGNFTVNVAIKQFLSPFQVTEQTVA